MQEGRKYPVVKFGILVGLAGFLIGEQFMSSFAPTSPHIDLMQVKRPVLQLLDVDLLVSLALHKINIQVDQVQQLNYIASILLSQTNPMSISHLKQIEHQFLCTVCQMNYPELFAVSQCSHRFCQNCSVAYISSQAGNFSQARCLQEGCKEPLDKKLPIYELLDTATVKKLKHFDEYMFLQSHPDHTTCKMLNCSGIFPIKDAKCNICRTPHCRKCLGIKHEKKCKQSEEDLIMAKLKYKRCPTCKIWVERNKGCQYMQCKCGTDFCYVCGTQFSKDPCRKKEVWEQQTQIRELLRKMPNIFTTAPLDIILLLPRLAILLVFLIPFTLLLCLIPLCTYIPLMGALVTLCMPLSCCEMDEKKSEGQKCCLRIVILILYPVLCCLSAIVFIIAVLLYPCYRNRDHHGVYDNLDKIVSGAAVCYLKGVSWLLGCLGCR